MLKTEIIVLGLCKVKPKTCSRTTVCYLFFYFRVDEFVVECPCLGRLDRIRIGHDNSGFGPGWFLDKVGVYLQTYRHAARCASKHNLTYQGLKLSFTREIHQNQGKILKGCLVTWQTCKKSLEYDVFIWLLSCIWKGAGAKSA